MKNPHITKELYSGINCQETQFVENIFEFNKRIIPLYKEYLDVI